MAFKIRTGIQGTRYTTLRHGTNPDITLSDTHIRKLVKRYKLVRILPLYEVAHDVSSIDTS